MYVSETTPGLEKTGLNRRGLISKPDTLVKLQDSAIDEIYIDTSKGRSSSYSSPVALAPIEAEPSTEFSEERIRAERVYGEARNLVGSLLNDVKMGRAIEVGPIEDLGREISESVLANSNALLCLS